MKIQARRLLVPFIAWTVFYAFFKLFKASQFGYVDSILNNMMNPLTWLDYFLLGSSQYHMHFLPTLFALILFHPLYKLASRYPALGLVLIPLVFIRDFFGGWLWTNVANYDALEYLARLSKILCYVGYGMAAYALFGLWKTKIDRETSSKIFCFALFSLILLFLIKLIQTVTIIKTGDFGLRTGAFYYAHYMIPVLSLTLLMSTQHFNWPDKLSLWSKYTFAMYLVHPAIIDVFDVLVRGIEFKPYQYTALKFFVAASGSLGCALLLGKIPLLAWTVGLGPLPFTTGKNPSRQEKAKTPIIHLETPTKP